MYLFFFGTLFECFSFPTQELVVICTLAVSLTLNFVPLFVCTQDHSLSLRFTSFQYQTTLHVVLGAGVVADADYGLLVLPVPLSVGVVAGHARLAIGDACWVLDEVGYGYVVGQEVCCPGHSVPSSWWVMT